MIKARTQFQKSLDVGCVGSFSLKLKQDFGFDNGIDISENAVKPAGIKAKSECLGKME